MCIRDREDGAQLSERETAFGLRTLRVVEKADRPGTPEYELAKRLQSQPRLKELDQNEDYAGYTVLVNGTKIFCKGANLSLIHILPSAPISIFTTKNDSGPTGWSASKNCCRSTSK